jgi:hypothetical protein
VNVVAIRVAVAGATGKMGRLALRLIDEADDPVTVGSGCSLSGGRWFSYYDRVNVYDSSDVDIDHMVPLAEAWDSGARNWATYTRERFANDLDDYRSLVGVTASSNRSKGDRDPVDWMPTYYKCRYLREWVAVKHRWRLTVEDGRGNLERTDTAAGLTMDVEALATISLGGVRVTQLANAGRIDVHEPAAVLDLERLLATDVAPWHGGMF